MPFAPPRLDDRSFDDLVAEVIARIPAHTPEWTHPRQGDPGRTLIELFAWLTDTLLYRANLIPERQRLAFLKLLGEQMRPAIAATGLVSVAFDEDGATQHVRLAPRAKLEGAVAFETRSELTVLPVTAQAYYKRSLTRQEQEDLTEVLTGLQELYQLDSGSTPLGYITTPLFADGLAKTEGFDLIRDSVDRSLWLALMAADPALIEPTIASLGGGDDGRPEIINIGIVPTISDPELFAETDPRAHLPYVWEISTGREIQGEPEYLTLERISDTTDGLTKQGVIRLALPAEEYIRAPENDVRDNLNAGVGDRPPRLDDPEQAARLLAWLRLRPTQRLESMSLSWVGINALGIDQRETVTGVIVGQSNGSADQEVKLPGQSIEPETLELQIEESGRGYVAWRLTDDLATAGRDDRLFGLDSEAGTVRFGDGVRGRIPEIGRRIRVAVMRAGGGAAGNLPAGSLTKISALDLDGNRVTRKLKVIQPVPTQGGTDAESLMDAERRIPALLRHQDRAVTEDDFKRLTADTPGVHVGRVDVIPRFKPHQRLFDVPGVVSVMVLPYKDLPRPPNPRPDRPFIERLYAHLDARRLVTTELYVIGCEYVPLGLSVGLTIRNGFGHETVINDVREALRQFLWSLPPGGHEGTGWPLGETVRDRVLEVVVARVPGVNTVRGINLFKSSNQQWRMLARARPSDPVELALEPWQLPELLNMIVIADDDPPEDLRGVPDPYADLAGGDGQGVAVPVVPEVC